MRELFQYDNRFFRVTGRLWDLCVLNLLWFLCSIPIITAGAAVMALFTATKGIHQGTDGYLVRGFLKAFRRHLKRGIMAELSMALLGLMLFCSIRFWGQCEGGLPMLCLVVSLAAVVLYGLVLLYAFPVLAFSKCRVWQGLGAAFLMAAQNFPRTLQMLLLITSAAVLVSSFTPAAMLFLFLGVPGLCYMMVVLGPWAADKEEEL